MSSATYYTGDVLNVLAKLPEGSVDLVLTSPPFLALRSYLPADHPDKALEGGSQSTPGEFIDWLLDVVEACDRVLAPHGSMCFELGDTFAGSGGAGGDYDPGGTRDGQTKYNRAVKEGFVDSDGRAKPRGVPNLNGKIQGGGPGWPADKSLSLIPETFRFALAYGFNTHTGRKTTPWRIRNVIRWVRPNPPVGALGDKFRPATSEMVVFCRTDEAGRRRYFDLDSVREANPRADEPGITGNKNLNSDRLGGNSPQNPAGAPPLDWWEIPTHPYKGAHYATWPPDLCVKPIKAMSPEKVCVTCGEPSRRVVGEADYVPSRTHRGGHTDLSESARVAEGVNQFVFGGGRASVVRQAPTLGWTDCGHDTWRPGVVLDPFAGSGTTLAVAIGHGRDAIGIDLDERNRELARDRVGPMFFHEA